MATEVEKPPSFPKYPEMILEAIGQDPKEGVNKSAISKYIESKFGDVPAGHANLLTSHLNSMKEAGEIVFFKNNYLLSDPTAPPRRGRGRPPKAKDPAAEKVASPPTSPRGRGRPRKDPNAEPAPKKPKPAADETAPTPEAKAGSGRPRGRPRKVIPAPAADASNGGV